MKDKKVERMIKELYELFTLYTLKVVLLVQNFNLVGKVFFQIPSTFSNIWIMLRKRRLMIVEVLPF